jgi:hypothetical protein
MFRSRDMQLRFPMKKNPFVGLVVYGKCELRYEEPFKAGFEQLLTSNRGLHRAVYYSVQRYYLT